MERRRGTVVRRAIPPQFGGGRTRQVNRRISEVLIDALADLHDVDYRAIGLETLGKPEGFLRRQIDGWAGRYERSKTRELKLVDDLVDWLHASEPASPPPTLLHNDWRLDNMMLDADDPGRVEAVFDWDMCTLGDPLCDLGTLLASWMEAGEGMSGASRRHDAVERARLPDPPRGGASATASGAASTSARCRTTTSSACSRSASCCSRSTTAITSARPRTRALPCSIRSPRCSSPWPRAAATR